MKRKDEVVVTVTTDSLRDKLYTMLNSEYSYHISEVIIENLARTEVGLEQLFKSMQGMRDTLKFKAGDEVLIHSGNAYSWKFDKDLMIAAGHMEKDYVHAVIVNADIYQRYPYRISYKTLKSDASDTAMQDVEEAHLHLKEDWSDLPDIIL